MDIIPNGIAADEAPETGHEESDASIRPLAMFLAGLSTSIIVVAVLVWILFYAFLGTVGTETVAHESPSVAAAGANHPQLQISPRRDLEILRQREDEVLGSTEWIDPNQRIARIPIQTAMEQVAAHGLPKWPPAVDQPSKNTNPSPGGVLNQVPLKPAQ